MSREFRKIRIYLKNSNSKCNEILTNFILNKVEEFYYHNLLVIPVIVSEEERQRLRKSGIKDLPMMVHKRRTYTGARAIMQELVSIGTPTFKKMSQMNAIDDEADLHSYMTSTINDEAANDDDDEADRADNMRKKAEEFMKRRTQGMPPKPAWAGGSRDRDDAMVTRQQRNGPASRPPMATQQPIGDGGRNTHQPNVGGIDPGDILRETGDNDDALMAQMLENQMETEGM